MLFENVVAQMLTASHHSLYFYSNPSRTDKDSRMEIDFLIRENNRVIPIEIKSGENKSIISLRKFKDKYGKKIGYGIVLHHGEIKKEGDVIYLPYYMAPLL